MFTRKIAVVQYKDFWRIVDQDGRQGEPLTYEVALEGAETLARVGVIAESLSERTLRSEPRTTQPIRIAGGRSSAVRTPVDSKRLPATCPRPAPARPCHRRA
jgi:hypothetical protein